MPKKWAYAFPIYDRKGFFVEQSKQQEDGSKVAARLEIVITRDGQIEIVRTGDQSLIVKYLDVLLPG